MHSEGTPNEIIAHAYAKAATATATRLIAGHTLDETRALIELVPLVAIERASAARGRPAVVRNFLSEIQPQVARNFQSRHARLLALCAQGFVDDNWSDIEAQARRLIEASAEPVGPT